MRLELLPLRNVPLVSPDADLVGLVLDAAASEHITLEPTDIVVVTGKIVSKAERRVVDLASVVPSARAQRLADLTEKDPRLVELVLGESVAVIRARPGNLLVRHRLGFVSAMAGIDRSNVEGGDDTALLLPVDPDASAARLRSGLASRLGHDVGVVITDSHGRPFRVGNVGVAIGASGVTAIRHLEGKPDLFGRPLTVASVVPVADLLASAAMLVSGEADEGIPVVIARGARAHDEPAPASTMIRDAERDLFAIPDRDYS